MAHTTELVNYTQTAPDRFELVIQCCGEHEHRHAVNSDVINDATRLKATIGGAHAEAARNHEARLQYQPRLEAYKGQKVEHS
jgi:hypothetical protein